jgi:hypothetical protein
MLPSTVKYSDLGNMTSRPVAALAGVQRRREKDVAVRVWHATGA